MVDGIPNRPKPFLFRWGGRSDHPGAEVRTSSQCPLCSAKGAEDSLLVLGGPMVGRMECIEKTGWKPTMILGQLHSHKSGKWVILPSNVPQFMLKTYLCLEQPNGYLARIQGQGWRKSRGGYSGGFMSWMHENRYNVVIVNTLNNQD